MVESWSGALFSLLEMVQDSVGVPGPARSRTFAAGVAGREGDGGGARCLHVDSNPRCVVSLGDLGFMPAFGAMPMECSPPSLAYSDWWSPATSSSLPPWWRRRERGGSGASSLNKCAAASDRADSVFPVLSSCRIGGGSGTCGRTWRGLSSGGMLPLDPSFQRGSLGRSCKGISSKLPSTASIMVVEKWWRSQGRIDTADGVRVHTRRWISRGCGALLGRCPASDEPPYPQVEGRPSSFLPATMPKGRQSCFTVESMTWSHGGLVGPSGAVPGAGEAESIGVQVVRIRLQSSSLVRGLVCIMQGLVCNFLFLWSPVVKCAIMLING